MEKTARNERHLWLIGYVDYFDKFGDRHRSGSARKYIPLPLLGSPNNLVFTTEPSREAAYTVVVLLTILACIVALSAPQGIFDLAVQYAFSGYAAFSVLLFAALFWKRRTKWEALAVAVWTAFAVI